MNILMMTNTFTPHVGGVARSIEAFSGRYRALGHRVMTVAPEFDNMPESETDVIRIPAIRHFNQTDFSLALPVPQNLSFNARQFQPDIVHSHHPFLVGGTALRIAHSLEVPLVFTHHTKYEDYTHNVPGDSPALKRFAQNLATRYANACDHVFAPSQSIATLIQQRGVKVPVSVVPTGVDNAHFQTGNGAAFRARLGIPADAFVLGHLGRLTPEKNIPFLAGAMIRCLREVSSQKQACALIVGEGQLAEQISLEFKQHGVLDKLYLHDYVDKAGVPDAYHAMNLFAFASQSETQGMVLTEAMAAGVPVVAVDAPGVREVVRDGKNGRLLQQADTDEFVAALAWVMAVDKRQYLHLVEGAKKTAAEFSLTRTADTALALYAALQQKGLTQPRPEFSSWTEAVNVMEAEWTLLKNTVSAAADSVY